MTDDLTRALRWRHDSVCAFERGGERCDCGLDAYRAALAAGAEPLTMNWRDPDPNAVQVNPGTFLHWGLYLRGPEAGRPLAATPPAPARAEGHAHGIDYDPEYKWLVHTEEEGASAIVARDVPAWFGVRVVAAFDYMAERLAATPTDPALDVKLRRSATMLLKAYDQSGGRLTANVAYWLADLRAALAPEQPE